MGNETGTPLSRTTAPDADVIAWRCEQLLTAGFPSDLAERVGAHWRYDLHALIELVEQGCPPGLAARILAPLSDDGLEGRG